MVEREVLQGGVANAGAVVREGAYVLRPSNPHSEVIHALFRHVRAAGFDGVPEPVGIDPDGRERLVFIPGETAWPPFPAWCQTDAALGSIAELLARFHAAARDSAAPMGATWNRELADPAGGSVICHNDVCVENVVFRGGVAVALLDVDFAAPGRPLYDLGVMARMCIPLDTPEDAAVWGREPLDPIRRLRLVADSYGLPPGREELKIRAELDRYRTAVPGAEITVCGLTTPERLRLERLHERMPPGPSRDWHLARTVELEGILADRAYEDFEVENGDRPIRDVALEVLSRAGWLPSEDVATAR